MSSSLICIGSAAERSLPVLFTALSCGAALPVSALNVFCFSRNHSADPELTGLAAGLSACHQLMQKESCSFFFPSDFSFEACTPVFRSVRELSEDPDAALLISALRGKGQPLSCLSDREAVEWCFSDLLARPDDPSVSPFFSWLSGCFDSSASGSPDHFILLADPADPFSAGIALVLLPFLRKKLNETNAFLSFIGLADSSSPLPESFHDFLFSSLRAMEDRSLLRRTAEETTSGADSFWLVSLPSSLADNSDSFQITALAAARIVGSLCSGEKTVPYGFHTVNTDGTLTLASLGDQAGSFTSFLQSSVWLLSDLFPSLRSWLHHPSRFRSLAPNSRNAMFRQLFSSRPSETVGNDLALIESSLKSLLAIILRFIRSVPFSLRFSPQNDEAWQQAVTACGRYITVASELDVSLAEARESGLDSVKPVHRASMADTEEEKLALRLKEMQHQLEDVDAGREKALSALGGYRSFQVRLDCLSRCRSALQNERNRSASTSDNLNNLESLKRLRRIRLLEAAVSRCESELDPFSEHSRISALPVRNATDSDPYSGCILNPDACRALEKWLDPQTNESALRISSLIPGLTETDSKQRQKKLSSMCSDAEPSGPLSFLVSRILNICHEEAAAFRFLSGSTLPSVTLLPDLFPETPFLQISDLLSCMPEQLQPERDPSGQRGLLAMLLLRQYRRRISSEASLICSCCLPGKSPVLRYWLSSRQAEKVFIFSLEYGNVSYPFALILPGRAFLPARQLSSQNILVPSFVTWFNPDDGTFSDPCLAVGEGDRMLLIELLSSYIDALQMAPPESSFLLFLKEFRQDLIREKGSLTPVSCLETRLKAVCGLSSLPAYEPSLTRNVCSYEHFLPSDQIGSCLTGKEDFPASICSEIPEEVLYLYRGTPFAREDTSLLLDSPHSAGEEYTLSRLKTECDVLSESSDDFRDALLQNLQKLLDRFPSVLPEICETVLSVMKDAEKPVEHREPVFKWPWDPKSPSMLAVLSECLGTGISKAILNPFSDVLCVFPARGRDVIGDSLLSEMCSVLPLNESPSENTAVSPDAVLPPLSPEFGRFLCSMPEGRTLLQPELLRFERFRKENDPSDSFRVTLTLDGVFPVHFVKDYSPENIRCLYSHDIPTLALWPSVPFRPEDWHAYYVYAHMKPVYTVSVLSSSGKYTDLSMNSENRYTGVFDSFPVCFSFSCEGKTAGLLPNMLPHPLLSSSDPVEICVDFGSSGTSVIFSSGRQRRPMNGPVMVRLLLNNPSVSGELLRREFLPAVPVSALLPTVTRLFRNVPGSSPVPFEDGIILMSSGLNDLLSTPSDAIYTSLKWEEEKGRSGFLCLHQVLLMAALQARTEGASSVSWRFAIPDEMAKEGRESLKNLYLSLCESVFHESGYPVPENGRAVSFASDSSAAGAYFRFCASDDTRGGFMVLDIGACTADISLFMRGREQAVRTCQIPLGVHYMLLPSLLRDPELLSRDYSLCTDESFRRDLSLLTRALSDARSEPVALRRARIALDYFISDHLPLLISVSQYLSSISRPSRSAALLLLHLAYLLMLSGLVLLQLASDPSRNDFLPEQMSLCLSGRGSTLLEALPPAQKTALWRFLSIFRSKRVASLSLLFSAEKKMEIPVGLSLLQDLYSELPPASSVPASIAVRPAELLPEFLLVFRREFPASAELLFPGFFTNDYYHPFSDYGESLISASIDQSFPQTDAPRPYDSLSSWIGNLLDLIRS